MQLKERQPEIDTCHHSRRSSQPTSMGLYLTNVTLSRPEKNYKLVCFTYYAQYI